MNQNLCCQINPLNKCRDCSGGVCKDHTGRLGRFINDLYWCEDCVSTKEDCIDLIADLTGKLEDALYEFHVIGDEIETVAEHTRSCSFCRCESPCQEIHSLIDTAARRANVSSRRVGKL